MSLGWVVAAIKIRPFEVGGADRAALVCLAEQTPKGARVSWASQEDLMATANVKTLSGIAKVIGRLVKLGLVEQVERGRYKHEARYALAFEEFVFDETAKRWVPPDGVGCPVGQPSTDQEADGGQGVGCPDGQATDGLVVPEGTVGCPTGQPIPVPSVDTNLIRDDRNLRSKKKDLDTTIIDTLRQVTGKTIPATWVPNVKRAIFGGDGAPSPDIKDPPAYAHITIVNEPNPVTRFLPTPDPPRLAGPQPAEPREPAPPPQPAPNGTPDRPTAPPMTADEAKAYVEDAQRQIREARRAREALRDKPAPPAPRDPTPDEEEHRRAQLAALEAWMAGNGQPHTPPEGTT